MISQATRSTTLPQSWQQHTFRAMGSRIAVWLETADPTAAAGAFAAVERLFAVQEQVMSRFRADSELSHLNARTGQWVLVSDDLWEAIVAALALAEATAGYFDPTVLPALQRAGYTESFERLARSGAARPPDADGGATTGSWSDIALDAAVQAIYLPPGLGLDLGGIGKGLTAQQAVELLDAVGPCLVDAGGDLVAGAAPQELAGWPVGVAFPSPEPDAPVQDLFTLRLAHAALATSGRDFRRWERDGREVHHLIDPFTGAPAESDLLTATVLAADAATAEAWATAVCVSGSAGLPRLTAANLAAALITRNNELILTQSLAGRVVESAWQVSYNHIGEQS